MQILNLLRTTIRETGGMIVWVTHNIDRALKFSDNVITINKGRVDIQPTPATRGELIDLLHKEEGAHPNLGPARLDKRAYGMLPMLKFYLTYALRDFFPHPKGVGIVILVFILLSKSLAGIFHVG